MSRFVRSFPHNVLEYYLKSVRLSVTLVACELDDRCGIAALSLFDIIHDNSSQLLQASLP